MPDNEICGPYLKVRGLSENEKDGGGGRTCGDWERDGRSGKKISSCRKKNKVLSYFTGEDVSSFLFYRFDSDILYLFHKVLVHKIFDSRWGFEYVEAMFYIRSPRGQKSF
jgi:hypothetical protein